PFRLHRQPWRVVLDFRCAAAGDPAAGAPVPQTPRALLPALHVSSRRDPDAAATEAAHRGRPGAARFFRTENAGRTGAAQPDGRRGSLPRPVQAAGGPADPAAAEPGLPGDRKSVV